MDNAFELRSVAEDGFTTEFETTAIVERAGNGVRAQAEAGLRQVDAQISELEKLVAEYNRDIDKLTNHADGLDYMVAVGSGILAGVIDIIFVGEFSLEKANQWGDDKANKFVVKIAQSKGYKGDDLPGAVAYLEKNFPIAADKATNAFGGGKQHHLRDFSHHPTVVGLFFSLLTQFTGKVYGTNTAGIFMAVALKDEDLVLIGKNLPEKIIFGVVNWFFHMVSDMAGSSTSIAGGSVGTGLPGPIGSLLKELSALPIFSKMNSQGYKEFSVWVSKLFNGTLLGKRDANGNLIPVKFDLRTELGVVMQLGKQAIPVIINECVVRTFYFIRRLHSELKEKNVRSTADLKLIDWEKTAPAKNRTIVRMLTISTGTMSAIDIADAAIESAIKSGGLTPAFIPNMLVRVNFVGVGRFAVAVYTDVSMGVQKAKVEDKKRYAESQLLNLTNTKLYYNSSLVMCSYADLYEKDEQMHRKEAALWKEVRNTDEAMIDLKNCITNVGHYMVQAVNDMDRNMAKIAEAVPEIEKHNPGLIDELLRRLQ